MNYIFSIFLLNFKKSLNCFFFQIIQLRNMITVFKSTGLETFIKHFVKHPILYLEVIEPNHSFVKESIWNLTFKLTLLSDDGVAQVCDLNQTRVIHLRHQRSAGQLIICYRYLDIGGTFIQIKC